MIIAAIPYIPDFGWAQSPMETPHPSPGPFESRVQTLIGSAAASRAHWGVLVVDPATGETVYNLHSDQFFSPASTTKLFTTALALAKLGPDYRFRTTLESIAAPDAHGHVRGDLYLIGHGAPDLTNRPYPYDPHVERDGRPEQALADMVDQLFAKGVRRVDGNIVVDESAIEDRPYPPGWDLDDVKYDYGAPVTALVVNDNAFFAEIAPAEKVGLRAHVTLQPPLAEIYVQNNIVTSSRRKETRIRIVWQPGTAVVRLEGHVPEGIKSQHFAFANPSPGEYAGRLLKFLLLQHSIKVTGGVQVLQAPPSDSEAQSPVPPNRFLLVEHLSPPLNQIVTMTNKNSQNLYAELMLRTVALAATGTGSLEAGLQIEKDFLQQAGVPADGISLEDGSGLSHGNLVTPAAVVALLCYAATQPWGADFRASLPIAGEDGTLMLQMKDTPAAGRIQAKTGTLEHAKAIAGYANTASGRPVVFAAFASQYSMTAHEAALALDGICTAMVEEIPPSKAGGCPQCQR